MADTPSTEQPIPDKPIDIQPRPRVPRLNRTVLIGLALVGILILWVMLAVLTRKPSGPRAAGTPRATTGRPLDIDRLRRAAPTSAPVAPAPMRRLPPPPPAAPRPARRSSQPDPEAIRARRALDASPVVSSFHHPAYYSSFAGSSSEPRGTPARGVLAQQRAPETGDAGEDLGLQRRKEAFLEAARNRTEPSALPAVLESPLSPYTLHEGSLLPAILTAGIHSDLPGQTTALIRGNVYDSVTGRHLLVPTGTRLLGTYDHRIAWGQQRVLVAWQRLIFPGGSSLDLGRMPGADLAGATGIRDRVNNHFVRTFGTAMALSAFSAAAQLSQPQESSNFGEATSARQVVAAALGQEINRTATQLLRRNLAVEPTLEIRPGYEFWVQLTADLVFSDAYRAGR